MPTVTASESSKHKDRYVAIFSGFLIAGFLSCLLFAGDEFKFATDHRSVAARIGERLGVHRSASLSELPASELEQQLRTIVEHYHFSVASAAIQLVQIVALSVAWYCGFRLWRRRARPSEPLEPHGTIDVPAATGRPDPALRATILDGAVYLGLPLLLSVFYVVLMRSVYVPAVLVLAMVAIVLAAEHFTELEHTGVNLQAANDRLTLVSGHIGKEAEDIRALLALNHDVESNLRAVADDIDKAALDVRTLLALEGGDQWRLRIYRNLSDQQTSWLGRMRYWDIDPAFLERAQVVIDRTETDFDRYWQGCVGSFSGYATEGDTLYRILADAARTAEGPDVGVRLIYSPPPVTAFNDGDQIRRTRAFYDLMGLMFQLIVFEMVNRQALRLHPPSDRLPPYELLPRTAYAKVRIGSHPPWVHVTGNNLYEVFAQGTDYYGQTMVRDIAANSPYSPIADRIALADYHKAALRRSLAMGGRSHAFVASLLLELFGGLAGKRTDAVEAWIARVKTRCASGFRDLPWFQQQSDRTQVQERFARVFVLLMVGMLEIFRTADAEQDGDAVDELLGGTVETAGARSPADRTPLTDALLLQALS